jgi:hypothetical protein
MTISVTHIIQRQMTQWWVTRLTLRNPAGERGFLPKEANGRDETLVRTAGYLAQYLNSGPPDYEVRFLPIRAQRFRGMDTTGSVSVM